MSISFQEAAERYDIKKERDAFISGYDLAQHHESTKASGQPVEITDKLSNVMLAHLDGIYKFSARENCDELVTQLILSHHAIEIELADLKAQRLDIKHD